MDRAFLKHRSCAWVLLLLLCSICGGQQRDLLPAYEVAVIKPDISGTGNTSTNESTGQIVFTNLTLKNLIERAYDVKPFQVIGPDWIADVRFDITAKYPPDTKKDARSLMLRNLLQERLKITVHHESKERSGFALVVAKGGFKLRPVEPGGASTSTNGGFVRTLTAKKIPMAGLADLIARNLDQMVVDQTEQEGVFDFVLKWMKEEAKPIANDTDSAPSVFTAVQETLGLRLQPQKIPVDFIVVDDAERVPTEN